MKMRELWRNKKSQALMIAIVVLAFVLIVGAGLLFHSRSQKDVAKIQKKTEAAYYLAKSGLEIAESKISSGSGGGGGGGSSGLCSDGGTVPSNGGNLDEEVYTFDSGTVTIKAVDGYITSVGRVKKVVSVLNKTVPVTGGVVPGEAVTTWAKAYGGSMWDEPSTIQQTTSDGGYIVAGRTYSFGAGIFDIQLMKTDADGGVLWSMAYGGTNLERTPGLNESERPYKGGILYQIPNNGGYIVGGWSNSFSGKNSWLVFRTDENGNIGGSYPGTWSRIYGGSSNDELFSLQPTFDSEGGTHNGYILSGQSGSYAEALVIKINLSGTVTWAKSYDPGDAARIGTTLQLFAGDGSPDGYIMGGFVDEKKGRDYLAIRTDTNGNVTWAKTYGLPDIYDYCENLIQTSDGGYILAGHSDVDDLQDALVIKIDADGNVIWAKTYGSSSVRDSINFIQHTLGGGVGNEGFIFGGETWYGSGDYQDSLVIKTDMQGNVEWAREYGDPGQQWLELFSSFAESSDGGYAFLGLTETWGAGNWDVKIVKTDANGLLCCSQAQDVSRDRTITVDDTINVNPTAISVGSSTVTLSTDEEPAGFVVTPFSPTVNSFCSNP